MIEAYAYHPLSRAAIIERINRSSPLLSAVRELDIAVDPHEEVTDQNHIGGALSTLRLAALAGVTAESRVLDLGCGIGGPARLLTEIFGCQVHGLDANPARISDAIALAELVQLDDRASFESADFLTYSYSHDYTLVWVQNSWIHVGDPLRLARIVVSALGESGQLAFEDVVLRRSEITPEEQRLLDEVSVAWRSSFSASGDWINGFAEAGLRIRSIAHDDRMMITHLSRLCALAERYPDRYPHHEIVGWRSALKLSRAGVLGYTRIVSAMS